MNTDTQDFLAALLFAYPENDEGDNPMDEYSIFSFSPEFILGAENFIKEFDSYLCERGIDIPETEDNFGGNVYFSLSGHGCGFWDEDETKEIHDALVKFSGNKYRFEHIDLCEDENGKLDLSFMPEYIKEYRDRLFSFN